MASLPTRTLGRTGLQVTTLGYGAMELRGRRLDDPKQAGAILNAVLDAGINFIDTSIDYGQSEELIGEFIAHRRSEYVLASKCGCLVEGFATPPPGVNHVYTRENIIAGVNQSLRRMKTDVLDVVQFHGSPSQETLQETGALQTLQDLKKEGKIRFIGSSSTLPSLADLIAAGDFDEFQIPYSALDREHEDTITQAAKAGAGTVIRGGAARGAGSEGRQGGQNWNVWERAQLDELLQGASPQEFIMRFTFSHPDLSTTIVGTLNPEHLQQNVNTLMKGPLPSDVYAEAKRRLGQASSS